MYNGYNETPLISYNEYNQERLEKKQENVAKWSYGHEAGVQPPQTHPNNRHSEIWPGKTNFLGVGNVVKCNCTGCYSSSENQSYQGESTRHRPWLPLTFPVPFNVSNESCKLTAYQWNNGFSNQGPSYPENNLAHVPENRGKYSYYMAYQSTRILEPNQPGVITSVKELEFGKKGKNEMTSREQESPIQNVAYGNPGYSFTKKPNGRNYCEANDKLSNVASYSVDQHLVRVPVVEPFIKAVPSNLSQNSVPSIGYRSVKDNMAQSYLDSGYCDPRKMIEPAMNGEKKPDSFQAGQLPTGVHIDYSHLQEAEPQKLFFDNTRHSDYYSRNSIQDAMKKNNQNPDIRKDCAMRMSEQQCDLTRSKCLDTDKFSYGNFYDNKQENPACHQRNEDTKNNNMNVHSRLPRSTLLFNDPRFPDRTQNSFPYQSNPNTYRNYLRSEYPYQNYSSQSHYDYSSGFRRSEINEFRGPPQQTQNCEQLSSSQQSSGFLCEPSSQQSPEKMQQFYLGKETVQNDLLDNRKLNYLEAIRSEEVSKNAASKISPLRLLRKKKFINVPQEPSPVSSVEAPPGLDVRKFWSTWADEEEENVAPTEMVVLDYQNIDPEQAKLFHIYETNPVRTVHIETGNIVINGIKETTEDIQQTTLKETKSNEQTKVQEEEKEKSLENNSTIMPEQETKFVEAKAFKKGKSGKKKTEVMDKWTEKKFDFLKRAEESKAAEILRHEEEKKKIIETRLSLQQNLKKTEKPQVDENSQSGTEDGSSDASNLPTCEYRRNKFLDYSEKNSVINGKGNNGLPENDLQNDIKKEKVECAENPTDVLLNMKLKEETGFEMEDILKKISEINFEGTDIKPRDDDKAITIRKSKKPKKKKVDQPEKVDQTDELTLETVTKPTFKFSIQKSHDLKISFKVLNSKEEESEDPQEKRSTLEDSEFTLKYKTFQRESDGNSSLRKRRFRKKKRIPDMKTPVLKIKKSRYMQQEEKDHLVADVEEGKPFEDGFQVQETVDSAKIKLTFKRHKGNFETEYKIKSSNMEKAWEGEQDLQEKESQEIKIDIKSKEEKATGIQNFQNYPDQRILERASTPPFQNPEENSKHFSTTTLEENYDFESLPSIFAEFPPVTSFEVTTPEDIFEESVKCDVIEDIDKPDQEQQRRKGINLVINDEEARVSQENSKKEIQEISSNFIKITRSPEIEINHKSGDSLEIENPDVKINCGVENLKETLNFSYEKSPRKFKTENDNETRNDLENQTGLLNIISVEGVDVEGAKMPENCLGENEERSSPEIRRGLENSLEDLIKCDFSPLRENSTPEKPSKTHSVTEAEELSSFNLEKSSFMSNSEFKVTNYSSISSESLLKNPVENFDITNFEPCEGSEPKQRLSDHSDVVDAQQFVQLCSAIETDDLSTNHIVVPSRFKTEDGEIVGTCGDITKKQRKMGRRHSISSKKRESQNTEAWSRKTFSKTKSCPPVLKFSETLTPDIPVENIPLPLGPPPFESCLDLEKYKTLFEAKETPKKSISPERVHLCEEPGFPFGLNDLEKYRNPSPPIASPALGILQRNSKIKFSISRRSKFSKLNLKNSKIVSPFEVVELKEEKKKEPTPKECKTKEVPKVFNEIEKPRNDLETVELLCEDLEDNVEVIDTMTNLIRDEFYECEDIPTSEDLNNGDDLENDKVNDDKFRNIMQNCLDNAKKFLNVGNLKLFSCSVDDLLELDCQPDPSLEDEPEKPTTHISRDVLLTSCGETEDLGLSENLRPEDISVDFVPSFCSDVCPEILPVDNWPYLEEEVTSSPGKPKQDEIDLIPALDCLECPLFCSVEKPGRKRVISETSLLQSFDDGFRISSNIGERRKTIDSFTDASYERDIRDIKNELIFLKNEKEKKSLKCRLSLEKLTSKNISLEFKSEKRHNGVTKNPKNLDYKTPSWQPKVMLFRISKSELRKVLNRKSQQQLSGEPHKLESKGESETENSLIKSEAKSEEFVGANNICSDVEKRRKKLRFRNLHTKRKADLDIASEKEVFDPEIALTEIFKNCDVKNTIKKETVSHWKSQGGSKLEEKNRRDKKVEERQKDKYRVNESRKHSRSGKERDDEKERTLRWVCEVCGFDEADKRTAHIKNHPFHCQSCHLAFKTESHFISHLTKKHKDIRNQHHCLLCELSFDTEEQYQSHLNTREHKHLESVEKNTINTLFTLLTGGPCPVLGLVEAKPEWLPNQAGTVHFYHQATPLSLALQYLKMHRDLSSFSATSSTHPT